MGLHATGWMAESLNCIRRAQIPRLPRIDEAYTAMSNRDCPFIFNPWPLPLVWSICLVARLRLSNHSWHLRDVDICPPMYSLLLIKLYYAVHAWLHYFSTNRQYTPTWVWRWSLGIQKGNWSRLRTHHGLEMMVVCLAHWDVSKNSKSSRLNCIHAGTRSA